MHQAHTPLADHRSDLRTATDLLAERMRLAPDHVAFGRRVDGALVDVTTSQFHSEVVATAKGLMALGVEQGERVAIMSPTRFEWAVLELAIWTAGAVVVPVYETSSQDQVASIITDARVRTIFAATTHHREVVEQASASVAVWLMDDDPGRDLTAVRSMGADIRADAVENRRLAAQPDDLAAIVYTSGSTGGQKGVRITHENFVAEVLQVAAAYQEVVNDRAITIVLLPLAHILAQGLQLVSIAAGMRIIHEGDPKSAIATMAEVRPTFMVVVPRVLQKIRAAARMKARQKKLGRVFASAERTAVAWGELQQKKQDYPGARVPRSLAVRHAVFDRLFYRKLRSLMGGRIEYLLSGAAPLDAELCHFFRGIGVPVIEGYGLTETTAPITANLPGASYAGTVGVPVPGATVRIADDGEVLVRGPGVSPGYVNPDHDVDAFVDGFFRTGDLGSLDAAGRLTLHGRRKNILVTASGKNVAPEPWEERVTTDPLVGYAVMVGEGAPYLSALIVLDVDEVLPWARHHEYTDLVGAVEHAVRSDGAERGVRIDDARLTARIGRAVADANSVVSRAEQVRKVTVLVANLSEQFGTLTPTMKLRREEFLAATAGHVADLYGDVRGEA